MNNGNLYTTMHFEEFAKHLPTYLKNTISVKRHVFLEMFANYKKYLAFLVEKTPKFGCYIYSDDIDITDFETMNQEIFYNVFVSKIYETVNNMTNIMANAQEEIKKEFGDNYKYNIIKSMNDYYNIFIKPFPVYYNINQNGLIEDLRIDNSIANLQLTALLDNIFDLTKDGKYVPDSILYSKDIIKKEVWLKRMADKTEFYFNTFLKSSFKDPDSNKETPKALVISVIKTLNTEEIVKKSSELMKENNLGVEELNKVSSYYFYILCAEPLKLDSYLKLNNQFPH